MGDVRRSKARHHMRCWKCSDPIGLGDDAGSMDGEICCESCLDFEDDGDDWWDDL